MTSSSRSRRRLEEASRYRRARAALFEHNVNMRRALVLRSIVMLTPQARSEFRDGPTIRQISEHSGIGRGCVERILLHLAKLGVIEKHYGQPGGVVLLLRRQ